MGISLHNESLGFLFNGAQPAALCLHRLGRLVFQGTRAEVAAATQTPQKGAAPQKEVGCGAPADLTLLIFCAVVCTIMGLNTRPLE